MNGELRIGLFTKRPVQVNEELTFDYQFQTFGKKRHKCYCGSEKCRGYLGSGGTNSNTGAAAANPTLDYIWEEDSSSGSDEDEDEDENDLDDQSDENANEEEDENENGNKCDRVDNSKDFDVIHI